MVKKWFQEFMPEELMEGLEDGLGWRLLGEAGEAVEWKILAEKRTGEGWEILVEGEGGYSDLQGAMVVEFVENQRAVVLSVNLKNKGKKPCPPLYGIHPLSLFWSQPKRPIFLRYSGGGLTDGFYPPIAYQEFTSELLSYASEPLTIEAGPDGRSSNRY
ncbi:MAG: hypothetical protein H5T69_21590, partial [Chloroflexi bacterium]|nr:hypothetical protein [Chloroflexota bacterium]